MSRPCHSTLLLAGLLGAACAEPTAMPPAGRAFSFIEPGGMPFNQIGIALPDTVRAGTSTVVPFYAWGSSSCTVAAGEDVETLGQVVTITPFDRAMPPGAVCTLDLRRFERQTTVRPPTGRVTFQLRGRRLGARPDDPLVTLSRTVTVLP
jgi:hypothetical protein